MAHASCRLIVFLLWIVGVLAGNTTSDTAVNRNFWCGQWAGRPFPRNRPVLPNEIPTADTVTRAFVQPELLAIPFGPIPTTSPIVQLPKIFGRGASAGFRE